MGRPILISQELKSIEEMSSVGYCVGTEVFPALKE